MAVPTGPGVPDLRVSSRSCRPPIMKPPRAVVFDMDGLMFNTEDVYFQVGDTVLQRRGHRFSRR